MTRPEHFDDDDVDVDEEALRWAGDEERGLAAPRLGGTAEPEVADDSADEAETAVPGSRGRAIATGVFAVPYLALAVGWILAVQNLSSGSASLFAEVLWQFGEFLAIVAAPLWFAATISLTRAARPRVRVGWLAVGVVVLVPWPLVLDFLAALRFAGSLA